jgi:hypothetical protein
MAIGRISGQLLKNNLTRGGVDLSFETDLLYLDVSDPISANHRVGIKNSNPAYTLDITGTINSTLVRGDELQIDDVNINDNIVRSTNGDLILRPETANDKVVVDLGILEVDNLNITSEQLQLGNLFLSGDALNTTITTVDTNSNLYLEANGTGLIYIMSNTNITANLTVDGELSAGEIVDTVIDCGEY